MMVYYFMVHHVMVRGHPPSVFARWRRRAQVVRLQEQCAALAAKASRVQAVADGADPQALAAKDREVERLKARREAAPRRSCKNAPFHGALYIM